MDLNTKLLLTFAVLGFASGWIVRGGAARETETPMTDVVFGLSWIGFIASALCKIWL